MNVVVRNLYSMLVTWDLMSTFPDHRMDFSGYSQVLAFITYLFFFELMIKFTITAAYVSGGAYGFVQSGCLIVAPYFHPLHRTCRRLRRASLLPNFAWNCTVALASLGSVLLNSLSDGIGRGVTIYTWGLHI